MFDNLLKQHKPLLEKAIAKWGDHSQIDMAIEECSELILVLSHFKRMDKTVSPRDIASEIADVSNLLAQLVILFDGIFKDKADMQELVREELQRKLERLALMLNERPLEQESIGLKNLLTKIEESYKVDRKEKVIHVGSKEFEDEATPEPFKGIIEVLRSEHGFVIQTFIETE